ncbi:CYTH domain-containing protein [Candidatus Galacturonibacter soehngenii]|uniref:CYTH domain-containing protein n=1 Tax=Candidatus Galacturonatibacter soehngenii TaxID=2307010 RepID=A0A7V7UDQ0_9FIRM|nr:CYTH domain-containing protein [Candidatus Galacturonibacter soehngenii]KAB1440967.1 CYTH domain-containing protein [Candidatus Galacturonibacter soehngenii]MBA4688743.1 CYTH domain-containing protein [Candidatus Galacturonibacter soehngenii]
MEIERKFLIKYLPDNLEKYACIAIEQAYLSTDPVVRVRKSNDNYTLTYKSKGFLSREEYNMPLTKDSYYHLREKADGNIISKKRYLIPYDSNLTIELDLFLEPFETLMLAEVEFDSEEQAKAFIPPDWFEKDVTFSKEYHNSYLSSKIFNV